MLLTNPGHAASAGEGFWHMPDHAPAGLRHSMVVRAASKRAS
jgi:hypothetical protein